MEELVDYIINSTENKVEEGKRYEIMKVAKRMLDMKMKDEEILKITHLTKEELEELKVHSIEEIFEEDNLLYNFFKEQLIEDEEDLTDVAVQLLKKMDMNREKGKREGKIKIVKEMIKNQLNDKDIMKIVDISKKELNHFKIQITFMPELEEDVNDVIIEEKIKGLKYGKMRMAERMVTEKMNDKDILRFTHISEEELEELKLNGIDEMFKEKEGVYEYLLEKEEKCEDLTLYGLYLRYVLYEVRLEGMKIGIENVAKEMIKSKKMKDEDILMLTFFKKEELEKLKTEIT